MKHPKTRLFKHGSYLIAVFPSYRAKQAFDAFLLRGGIKWFRALIKEWDCVRIDYVILPQELNHVIR